VKCSTPSTFGMAVPFAQMFPRARDYARVMDGDNTDKGAELPS
jgi:hypothetical protein